MTSLVQSTYISQDPHNFQMRSIPVWISKHITLLNILSFVLLVIVFCAFIVQVNNSASKGYQIHDLEKKIDQLSLENQQSELEIQQAQSLGNIQRAVKMIGMVPAEQAVYVDAKAGSVAFAK